MGKHLDLSVIGTQKEVAAFEAGATAADSADLRIPDELTDEERDYWFRGLHARLRKPRPVPGTANPLTALTRLRAAGWMVAVHNDYRQDGKLMTFWLFTREGFAVKGEGETDAEALARVVDEIKGRDR